MDNLLITISSLSAVILSCTQLIKTRFGIAGSAVSWLAILVGATIGGSLGGAGLPEFRLLEAIHPALSGVIMGVLAGVTASGGVRLVKEVTTDHAAEGALAAQRAKDLAGWEKGE